MCTILYPTSTALTSTGVHHVPLKRCSYGEWGQYIGCGIAAWDNDLIGNQSEWIKVLTVVGFPSFLLLRRALNPEHVDKWGTPQGLVTPARGGNPGPIGTSGVGIIEAPPRLFVAGNYLSKTMYKNTKSRPFPNLTLSCGLSDPSKDMPVR